MVYRVYRPRRNSLFEIINSFSLTSMIIFLNVIFFIFAIILISINPFYLEYIALKPANIFLGLYLWTFLTSLFMHGGIFHLFVNMFTLFFIGGLVEKIIGWKRYLTFYLVSGLFAGLLFVGLEFVFPTNPNIAAVGASGALFGLIGILVFLTPNLPVYMMFIPIPIKMKYAGPGILFLIWLISLSPTIFGGQQILIGNIAHLGGFVCGLIYGFYLKNKYHRKVQIISRHFS